MSDKKLILSDGGEAVLEAASGVRKFRIEAYSGGPMRHPDYGVPVVVDLKGMRVAKESLPILSDHRGTLEASVGHTEAIEVGDSVIASGVFSGANAATDEVVSKLQNGMQLQASIGIRFKVANRIRIPEGETLQANGRTFEGPLVFIRQSELYEISVVPLGADQDTAVRLAASTFQQEALMATPFETWAAERGVSVADLSDAHREKLEATFASETADKALAGDDAEAPEAEATVQATGTKEPEVMEQDYRAQRAELVASCDRIESICKKHGNPSIEVDGDTVSLAAHALRNGWSEDKTELEALRSSRPKAPSAHVSGSPEASEKVFECSLAAQFGIGEEKLLNAYGEKAVELAHSPRYRSLSIQRLMGEQIMRATGIPVPVGTTGDQLIRDYKDAQRELSLKASGFTTYSLPNILGAVANKVAWEGVQSASSVYRQLTRVVNNRNFQTHTHIRLTSAEMYQEIGKDGEIKQGKLHEETYTTQLKTKAVMISLTRQDIVNDDLSLFNDLPRQLGRSYETNKDKAFISLVEASDASFYDATDGVSSLLASNALGDAGLTAAYTEWALKRDVANELLGLTPRILFVPAQLRDLADRLMNARETNETTTADTPAPNYNPHRGKYMIVESPRLTSATTWYLMTDPSDVGVFADVRLNGQDGPTIEQEDAPFDVLGTRWRAYFDTGVAKIANDGILKNTAG